MSAVDEITSVRQMAIDRLAWSRGFLEKILQSLSDEQLTARAGGKGNHALWVMGHLAVSEDMLVAQLSGQPTRIDEQLAKRFVSGSEPSDNAADYPSRDEMLKLLRDSRRRTIEWIESLDEQTTHKPVPEPLRAFAPDAISTALTIFAHETFHTGQLASVRAALGLPRLFM